MKSIVDEYYEPLLLAELFKESENNGSYPKVGKCWEIDHTKGIGYFWTYKSSKGYNIKIHDFSFNEDFMMDMSIPECLSITYYSSIAGEELSPYRQLRRNTVKTFLGGYEPFRAIIHRNVPVCSVGIEYEPPYYETFLKNTYGELYQDPHSAFDEIGETTDFSDMILLLNQVQNYKGEGALADLFFDAKAAEALSLVFERHQNSHKAKEKVLSPEDIKMMDNLAAYIGDHYADHLSNELFSKIACMGATKLKKCFHTHFECTITEYIQKTRINKAEHLLAYTDLPVVQVAQAVGYNNAGRFAELYRKEKGILPMEYRKSTKR